MKTRNTILMTILMTTSTLISTLISVQSYANDSASDNASAASKHSVLAASHGTLASAKVGSAVVATPLLVVGAVGETSKQAGVKLMENAVGNKPLEVTDKTIIAAPSPAQMMKKAEQKEK